MILFIVIILFLLGNLTALDVAYLRSPAFQQAQNITTLLNNANNANNTQSIKELDVKAMVCMTLLSSLPPKSYPCSSCSDDHAFYNVSTFCTLKTMWANSFNTTSIETNLRWMKDSEFCKWGGIQCDDSNNIISIDLDLPNTPITLDDQIGRLKTLQQVSFTGNHEIPNDVIPKTMFQLENLQNLSLISTGMKGPVPNTFDKMPSLKRLRISFNTRLDATFPDTLSTLSLESLIITQQNFTGAIPDYIGNSKSLQSNLKTLDLSFNRFTGNIPDSLMDLQKLTALKLTGNSLSGEIPPSLFTSKFLESLITLELGESGFNGTIPTSFNRFVNLVDIVLPNNSFTGTIPVELSTLKNLSNINVNFNKLSGPIPNFVGNMDLFHFQIRGNAFTGPIPTNLCGSHIRFCDLAQNQLTFPNASCNTCQLA